MKITLAVCAMAMSMACGLCAAAGQFNLGDLKSLTDNPQKAMDQMKRVSDVMRDFTEPEEIAIGQEMASNLLGAVPLYANARAQRYVNQVGHVLAAQTERANLEWHFAVLDDMELNAFAAPGGYVFITRGLLMSMHNEAELAGVLAHEIAHVVKKHQLAAIKSAAKTSLGREFGAGLLKANGELTPLIHKLASVGTEMLLRGLDKKDEFEADRMGVVIATRAGYNPYGLPAVLQALQTVNPDNAGMALMFKTHPPLAARLGILAQMMTESFDQFENQPDLAERFKSTMATSKYGK